MANQILGGRNFDSKLGAQVGRFSGFARYRRMVSAIALAIAILTVGYTAGKLHSFGTPRAADVVCAPITRPTTIETPGNYCLMNDITIDTPNVHGIVIASPSVNIHMQGHRIVGPDTGVGIGIYATNLSNISVIGGRIYGFLFGLKIEGPDAYVEGMTISRSGFRGIFILGENSVIRNNIVSDLDGSNLFPDSHTIGIETEGHNCKIEYNTVDDILPFGDKEGVGISISQKAGGCRVFKNYVRWSKLPLKGRTLGIWVGTDESTLIMDENVVISSDYGLFGHRVSVNADDSVVIQRCPAYWEFSASNSVTISGECTDPEAPLHRRPLRSGNPQAK